MSNEYLPLKALEDNQGYKILEALWIHQVAEIEKARDKAAQRGNDSSWRYWAGQEKGFKLAMTALARAMVQMQKEDENVESQSRIDKLLEEIKK